MQHRGLEHTCSLRMTSAAVASFLWSSNVHAQASEIAKKLLDEAKQLREAGKISEACPLLDRSYEMDAKREWRTGARMQSALQKLFGCAHRRKQWNLLEYFQWKRS